MTTAERSLNQADIALTETNSQLGEYSHLATLPRRKPDIYLYSLEKTEGQRTIVHVGDVTIGGPEIVVMAGPCAIENYDQTYEAALAAKEAGAKILRGGSFKPRTKPYSFQGLGEEGLRIQRTIANKLDMLVVTEATGERNVDIVAAYADIIQVGARNAQNFELLAQIAKAAKERGRAILYKRGKWMTLDEWLWGAEYILYHLEGTQLILCERGTMMPDGAVDLDDNGIRALRTMTHLPIVADPTHASECSEEVPERIGRAIAADADGLIIETHPRPEKALSDGQRALRPETLIAVTREINAIAPPGRYFGTLPRI